PHCVPPGVHCRSHLPSGVQKKPLGQLLAAPGAGSQVVPHAAGGGSSEHRLPNVLEPPQAASVRRSEAKTTRMAVRTTASAAPLANRTHLARWIWGHSTLRTRDPPTVIEHALLAGV